MDLFAQARAAKAASRSMALCTTSQKNEALQRIAEALLGHQNEILEANAVDVEHARAAGQTSMLDRLLLTEERLKGIVAELQTVIELEDEVGKIIDERTRPNGLNMQRVRCPLGVVGMIYESRPNVTVDATVLCLKSGNAVMLKGGSDALSSNRALVNAMHAGLSKSSLPKEAVQFLDTTDREVTRQFLELKGYLDVIIPRTGGAMIDFVRQHAMAPVIETGASVVHLYIDEAADMEKALAIAVNSKTRRVSICNALDTLLVHTKVAEDFLRQLAPLMLEKNVELRCDEKSLCILKSTMCGKTPEDACERNLDPLKNVCAANADDFGKEFLDTVLAIKVVRDLDEALEHIARYSLKHTESIVTEHRETAERFLREVDSACVYWNASTQFSDGAEFGLGAEIGISTQKLHVRGPFALEGLTSFKWVVRGDGQVRE